MKLTKMQVKNNERIDAWVEGKTFQENARSKPSVPDLACEDVLRDYTPQSPESTAQYFTPLGAAEFLAGYVTDHIVLEPCAGIGSLLYPFHEYVPVIDAWEMDIRAYNVGKKLFPEVRWTLGNAFEIFSAIGMEKDRLCECVVMNPPYNIQWGLYSAERWSVSGAKKSEHLFMELALRALVPGGTVLAILSNLYMETLPAKFHLWMDKQAYVNSSWSLDAQFKNTGVRTSLFHITKKEV